MPTNLARCKTVVRKISRVLSKSRPALSWCQAPSVHFSHGYFCVRGENFGRWFFTIAPFCKIGTGKAYSIELALSTGTSRELQEVKESAIERSFSAWCEQRGWLCLKLRWLVGRGFPDRTVLLPGGRVVFIEFKTPKGTVSPHQVYWRELLQKLGFTVGVARSSEEAQRICMNAFI